MRNILATHVARGEISDTLVVRFARDARQLEDSGTAGIDDVFETVADAQQADNIVGMADELKTAAAVENGEIPARSTDVIYVSRVIKDSNGQDIVDVDADLSNGDIVESKGQIRGSERMKQKLDNFVAAHEAGKIDINNQEITVVSSNRPATNIKTEIRQRARDIESGSSNSIRSLQIEFATR